MSLDTRSAHCITIATLASLTLAHGDKAAALDRDARKRLEDAQRSIALILAWDRKAVEEQEARDCPCSQDYTTDPQCCAAGECVRAAE